jgi:predicted enzyme related to lactoylglutathione lyase
LSDKCTCAAQHTPADTTLSAAPAQDAISLHPLEIDMPQATAQHAVHWFEIPVRNMNRAQAFYETLLAAPLRREQMGPHTLAVFHCDEAGVGGCLLAGDDAPEPASNGALVYLNAEPSLDAVLARVETAGGRISTPKVQLPGDMGVYAHITDTEGNRVGLHALS